MDVATTRPRPSLLKGWRERDAPICRKRLRVRLIAVPALQIVMLFAIEVPWLRRQRHRHTWLRCRSQSDCSGWVGLTGCRIDRPAGLPRRRIEHEVYVGTTPPFNSRKVLLDANELRQHLDNRIIRILCG